MQNVSQLATAQWTKNKLGLSFGSPNYFTYLCITKQTNHMNYNLSNIHTSQSYNALKRMGFTDLDVVAYYGTEKADRTAFINDVKAQKLGISKIVDIPQPKPTVEKRGTQKCTANVTVDAVRDMALEYMDKDWTYRGRTFNLNKLGWRFAFNDKKRALGSCYNGRRVIYISQWFIEHNTREMKMWKNTMVHEIAHAINGMMGGRGHDSQWKNIFISFGGNGNRTSDDAEFTDLLEKPVSKYTTICPNGHTRPMHKYSTIIAEGRRACTTCCNEHANGRFDSRFKLRQIQNY